MYQILISVAGTGIKVGSEDYDVWQTRLSQQQSQVELGA